MGSLYYWIHFERKHSNPKYPPELRRYPKIALVVPCFNEAKNIRGTLLNLLGQNYPDFEIIAINDGSTDHSAEILLELARQYPKIRVITQLENQGKAIGLTSAALLTDAEFLLCIDGDALLDHQAARWMLQHFIGSPRVGAVTGNPRIRNRSTLLGKIQVGEFSSIIGLIKRAQRTYGRLFTVSGVCAMFRKSALTDVGFWSPETLTEDIDISWKLQIRHWDVRFEPAATCWILMPETLKGLWSQRLRWATGGTQAMIKYAPLLINWKSRRMWPIFLEYGLSLFWAYSMLIVAIVFALSAMFIFPQNFEITALLPGWSGTLIAITSLIQIGFSLILDSRYDHRLLRNYFFIIWYPLAYWVLNMLTAIVSFPSALLRDKSERGTWKSPDRGLV